MRASLCCRARNAPCACFQRVAPLHLRAYHRAATCSRVMVATGSVTADGSHEVAGDRTLPWQCAADIAISRGSMRKPLMVLLVVLCLIMSVVGGLLPILQGWIFFVLALYLLATEFETG